jgi:hypothetical protein
VTESWIFGVIRIVGRASVADSSPFRDRWIGKKCGYTFGGGSTVPSGVHGPHRKIRLVASHPPRTAPNFLITASP